jgi:hypothetical protein
MTKKFVGYLNTNNQKAASAMGCEGSKLRIQDVPGEPLCVRIFQTP